MPASSSPASSSSSASVVQYLNFTFNPGFSHRPQPQRRAPRPGPPASTTCAEPVLHVLPPAYRRPRHRRRRRRPQPARPRSRPRGPPLDQPSSCAIFGSRMYREYRGENLSEANVTPVIAPATAPRATSTPAPSTVAAASVARNPQPASRKAAPSTAPHRRRLPLQGVDLPPPQHRPVPTACSPPSPWSSSSPCAWARTSRTTGGSSPAAVAYSVLGVAALAYNSLGLDAEGVQFYFLAPIHMGDVLLAKTHLLLRRQPRRNPRHLRPDHLRRRRPFPSPRCLPPCFGSSSPSSLIRTPPSATSAPSPRPKRWIPPSSPAARARSSADSWPSASCSPCPPSALYSSPAAAYLGYPWLPAPILAVLPSAPSPSTGAASKKIDRLAQTHRETMIEELAKPS